MKSTLKPPGTKRLKLEHENPLSSFAFNFNLRCYIWNLHSSSDDGEAARVWRAEQVGLVPLLAASHGATLCPSDRHAAALLLQIDAAAGGGALQGIGYLWAGAYTRPLSSSP